MTSYYTVRDWVTIGLFGALWGTVELTLGSILHAIYPPLTDTFLTGVALSGIGVALALTGRHFVQKRGAVVLIGVVTALLKLLSVSGAKAGPVIAILIESTLMEIVLWIAHASRWAFITGGALAAGWNVPHMLIMPQILLGKSAAEAYTKLIQQGSQWLGLDPSITLVILAALLIIQLTVGAVGGWGAWNLGRAVTRRLQPHEGNR
jgi:hypothetical protein